MTLDISIRSEDGRTHPVTLSTEICGNRDQYMVNTIQIHNGGHPLTRKLYEVWLPSPDEIIKRANNVLGITDTWISEYPEEYIATTLNDTITIELQSSFKSDDAIYGLLLAALVYGISISPM